MERLMDCNVVILHLKDAKKNDRRNICIEHFQNLQHGAIIIDKMFEIIQYFPESFFTYEVQAYAKNNCCKTFLSVSKCLCSLNQQRLNVVLVDSMRAYVADRTEGLVQIFQDLSGKYGGIFHVDNDAITNRMKVKTESTNRVKRENSLKHKRKGIVILQPGAKMTPDLRSETYLPDLETLESPSIPIFRTSNISPPSLMEVLSSNIDPYGAPSSLGEIVADCDGPDLVSVSTDHRPANQPDVRDYSVYNATVNNVNVIGTRHLEDDSSLGSTPAPNHGVQHQRGNRQQSPKYPRYSTYEARRASYPVSGEFLDIDTNEMARTGLVYTGKTDEVQCFQCGLEQHNWRPDKDPLLVHIKESPDCQFLETLLGVNTLNQYKAQISSSGKISGREHFSSSSTNATGGNSAPHYTANDHIRSPQYQAYYTRLLTFTKWPPSMTQKPEDLAQAGFYYTGLQDVVSCFTCDGGLKNWDPEDDPWTEHARWFPQCSFVLKVKGQEFIERVRCMMEESDKEQDVVVHSDFQRNPPMINHLNSQHLSNGNGTDTETILWENKFFKRIITCITCKSQARNVLFLPCSHHCLCQMCADKCTLCPKCNRNIQQKIKTFMG